MKTFWATFCLKDRRSGYIVEVHAETFQKADEKLFQRFGRGGWCFTYSDFTKIHPNDRIKGVLEVLT